MPELLPQERLQPALLDRLIDNEPEVSVESRESRLITVAKLRAAVLRDLSWLLNCSSVLHYDKSVQVCPEVMASTVNYGLPPFSGQTASGLDLEHLESAIRESILRFEPRLVAESLIVRAVSSQTSLDHHNQIEIEISGSLWSVPVPIEMLLHTSLDLESGQIDVREVAH